MTRALPLLGIGLPVSGGWARPATTVEVATRAESLGYASLWTYQRLLRPVGSDLSPSHDAVLDPVVALAYVAGATHRIGLGTATVCAPFTPPVVLAKALASLDVVSGGRLTAGLGTGWMPEEHVAAGVPLERRWARMDEYLRCLVALWTQDPVEHRGEFYVVPPSHVRPTPVQRPHPPVLVGGVSSAALRRAGGLAQGWIGSSEQDPATLGGAGRAVRAAAVEAGRDPDAVRVVVRRVVELADADLGAGRPAFHGSRAQVLSDLADLRAEGVTEVIVDLNLSPRVVGPDVDPAAADAYVDLVLDALAPG